VVPEKNVTAEHAAEIEFLGPVFTDFIFRQRVSLMCECNYCNRSMYTRVYAGAPTGFQARVGKNLFENAHPDFFQGTLPPPVPAHLSLCYCEVTTLKLPSLYPVFLRDLRAIYLL